MLAIAASGALNQSSTAYVGKICHNMDVSPYTKFTMGGSFFLTIVFLILAFRSLLKTTDYMSDKSIAGSLFTTLSLFSCITSVVMFFVCDTFYTKIGTLQIVNGNVVCVETLNTIDKKEGEN